MPCTLGSAEVPEEDGHGLPINDGSSNSGSISSSDRALSRLLCLRISCMHIVFLITDATQSATHGY